MADLKELYRQVILDHYRNPRRRGKLSSPHVHAEGLNPSCGDEFFLDIRVEDGTITDAAIGGQGCSISQASASMMTEIVKGKPVDTADGTAELFRSMVRGETEGDDSLGDLEALQGVRKFPVRIKCADLPWTTLAEALERAEV